ncbi:DUF192 domain-containing protein [Acinetobacter sp. dk771]|uniref:DUF192 domain-containing protein n=2 Tax=Acinetobacter wanghuae TaxID=2662362 RepID=A0AA90W5U0_9GAMM|nr:DUF192 domain-containing protein [Acinetobacter wanghuae]
MAFKQVYNPYFDQDEEVKTFSFNGKKLTALYLYREHHQEIGFKENPLLKPLVFTWKKPIYTCFNMVNVPYDLEIFFFNADKKIIGSAVMEKFSKKQYCPKEKIQFALERIKT